MANLRGITWDHPRGYEPLEACSRLYAEACGVQVEWKWRSLKDFGDLPIDQIAKDYDLLIIDHPHVGLAASSGCLTPLESCLPPATLAALAAASAGPSHASYLYGGRQWGLAIDAAMQVAAYRPDKLDALPATWDEVTALAGRLRKQGLWMATPLCPTDAICSFLTLCANLRAPIEEEWVAREVGMQALEMLRGISAASHPLSLAANPIAVLDQLATGDEIVFCPIAFCYSNYARDGFRRALVQFGPLPGVQGSLLGGAGIAVSAFSAHQESACAYCAWICSDSVVNGGQPGNRTAWLDPRANEITHDYFRQTLPALEGAYVRPRYAGFVTFQEQAGRVIQAYLRDGTSTQACLATLENAFRTCKKGE
jgi:multiple sugar transport system substrate-binding protein